ILLSEPPVLLESNISYQFQDLLQVVFLFALAWMDFHELELMGDLLFIGIQNLEVD
ncbi:hypothetical protein Tco_0647165, partial [Tanacetum coccineum]